MSFFKKPDSRPSFPEIESQIAKFWEENMIFEKSVESRKDKPYWTFYDGPPFISGTPHYGHIKDFIVKDTVPRYWSMKGYYTPRIWGWDCHGLAIENKVEKKLGLKSRLEVDEFGVEKYVEECYKYTRETSAEWPWYIEKMGRWIDYDHAFRTMDQDYMESVWWVFKTLWEKDLIYKGWRSSLYSTDSASPVSNFEVAMDNTYEDVEDDTVVVKFAVKESSLGSGIFTDIEDQLKGRPVSFLSWTTTPWTLFSNFGLAVNPDEDYAIVETSKDNAKLIRSWLIKDLPFDYEKGEKESIEEFYLKVAGEDTDENADWIKDSGIDADTLKEVDVYITKIGKKFYFVVDDHIDEIEQREYQLLRNQAPYQAISKTRYYYRPEDEAEAGVEIEADAESDAESDADAEAGSEKSKASPEIYIDIYEGYLEGLQLAEIHFNSPVEYAEFIKDEPDWFGKETSVVEDFGDKLLVKLDEKTVNQYERVISEVNNSTNDLPKYDPEDYKQVLILAFDLAQEVLRSSYKILKTVKGTELAGIEYEQLYSYLKGGENDFKVYTADFVTTTEGTGVTHIAPAYGEEDFNLGQENGLSMKQAVDDQGNLIKKIEKFEGQYLRDAALPIIIDLNQNGKLYKSFKFTHRLPFYRYKNPLIYRAQESWFVNIQKIKDELLAENENINWIPDHLKEGRFKKGIETAPDWSLSRSRYWATSMPVWVVEDEEKKGTPKRNYEKEDLVVVGSRDELRDMALNKITKIEFELSSDDHVDTDVFDQNITDELKAANQNLADALKEVKNIHLLEEKKLKEIFGEVMSSVEAAFKKFLVEKEGGSEKLQINEDYVALLKTIFEGKTLKESLSSRIGKRSGIQGLYTMYFLKDRLMDMHRPVIDDVKLKHPETGETMVRIPEVLDNWMDAGSMPFSQIHYPFENEEKHEKTFPGDFVFEYISQTRAWFYVMHVLGVALKGQNPFKNVMCSGVIFGTDGRKMSKTYGNYPDPRKTIENYGAEAMRWYILKSKMIVGEDMRFDEKTLRDQLRVYILPIWNIYKFFAIYANVHSWKPTERFDLTEVNEKKIDQLDVWVIALLHKTIGDVRIEMDAYNLPSAVRILEDFVEKLSKWYVRRSRDRFSDGDAQAFGTLYYVLTELMKLTAPFTPFLAEKIYSELTGSADGNQEKILNIKESVHLCDYPEDDLKLVEDNAELLSEMEDVLEIVSLGQSLRAQNQIKVRQPLAEIEVVINTEADEEKQLEPWMKDLVAEELNIQKVEEKSKLVEREGWLANENQEKTIKINIDTNLTPELKEIGQYRDLVRSIQSTRKKRKFSIGDEIEVIFYMTKESSQHSKDFEKFLKKHAKNLKSDVGATNIMIKELAEKEDTSKYRQIKSDGEKLYINLIKV